MSSSNCCFLTCIQISQEADQVVWYSHLLKDFPQFVVIHTVKGFGIVNKAEIDIFLELSCVFFFFFFCDDPTDFGNLISIPLLGIYPEETKIEKDTCTPLFTIARTWKQPGCPSTDEWIKKLWHIYTMEYYLSIKRNTFESFLMRWMNLEPIIQSEVSQKEKNKYCMLMCLNI